MKSEKKIFIAFILNFLFSISELIGGIFTNSVSIISDAVHDFGDSISIAISCFLENKSKNHPDDKYTYGYARYSILGAVITNSILTVGSILVIYNGIVRLINPVDVNYDGMLVFALIGVIVNFIAVYFTKGGHSLNQKSVNVHMLEDVFGWLIVLIGSIVIRFTKINQIDSIMSILLALFILNHVIKNFKLVLNLFLEKIPNDLSLNEIKEHLIKLDEVIDVHHIHIRSIDGINNYATMHVVTDCKDSSVIKEKIKEKLKLFNINHTTIEIEKSSEKCEDFECHIENKCHSHHH